MACIPIGIDLGSLNARIAIASLPKESPSSSLTAIQAFEKSIGIKPSSSSSGTNTSSNITSNVISNAHTGSRYTMAVAVCENEEISMANDEQRNQRLKQPESSTSSFVFGDAARKILERRKIPLEDSLVRAMGLQLGSALTNDGEDSAEGVAAKEEACVSFFAYLGQLAAENVKVDGAAVTNGAASGAPDLTQELLRVVLSLPVHKYAIPTHPGSVSPTGDAVTNNQEIASLLRCVRTGMERSGTAASTAAGRKKKRGSAKFPHPKYVVGVLHDATAVCVAHGLTDVVCARPIHFEKKEEIEGQRSNWKSCLVIDWGDSGFTATILKKGGGDTAGDTASAAPLEIVDYLHDPTLSGSTITKLVMKHISDMFERKNRLPANSIAENKRATSKLRACVEDAIRSLARSNGARNTNLSLDGLYEGIDLHLPLSRPRFDMLCGKVLKSAEVLIGKMMARARELNGGEEGLLFDVVLTSGNVSMMPSVQTLVTKLCAQMVTNTNSSNTSTPWRGDASIPVDEAVVIGCSKHASMLLHDNLHLETTPAPTVTPSLADPTTSIEVPVSPVTIGIRLLDDQEATLDGVPQRTLIAEGTPLPAYARHTIDLGSFAKPPSQAGADNPTTTQDLVLAIVQPSDEVDGKPIVLGQISIPKDSTPYVNLSLSLSITGELAMSVNGSELVTV